MYNGSSEISLEVSRNLSNCSSDILPLLISFDFIRDCSAKILVIIVQMTFQMKKATMMTCLSLDFFNIESDIGC